MIISNVKCLGRLIIQCHHKTVPILTEEWLNWAFQRKWCLWHQNDLIGQNLLHMIYCRWKQAQKNSIVCLPTPPLPVCNGCQRMVRTTRTHTLTHVSNERIIKKPSFILIFFPVFSIRKFYLALHWILLGTLAAPKPILKPNLYPYPLIWFLIIPYSTLVG